VADANSALLDHVRLIQAEMRGLGRNILVVEVDFPKAVLFCGKRHAKHPLDGAPVKLS